MFTFRAEHWHSSDGPARSYEVFEASHYRVKSVKGTDGYEVELAHWPLEASKEPSLTLYVGSNNPFSSIYVMNQNGKTVDTIR